MTAEEGCQIRDFSCANAGEAVTNAAKRTAKREQRTKCDMADHNSESILGTPGPPITFVRGMAGIFAGSWSEARRTKRQ